MATKARTRRWAEARYLRLGFAKNDPIAQAAKAISQANLEWWLAQGYTHSTAEHCINNVARQHLCRPAKFEHRAACPCRYGQRIEYLENGQRSDWDHVWDHVDTWNHPARGRVITAQPYLANDPESVPKSLSEALASFGLSIVVVPNRSFWYPPSTVLIVVSVGVDGVVKESDSVHAILAQSLNAGIASMTRNGEGGIITP